MSLSEVLGGMHWEAECSSDTTGMGPLWVNEVSERPHWAVLYLIHTLEPEDELYKDHWEIGVAQDFTAGMASMPRAPILSSSGLGVLEDLPPGRKSISFSDAVPEALKRYMRRLEAPDPTLAQVREATRVAAWERLAEASRKRTEG